MSEPSDVLIVVPTLGDRIELLGQTLTSIARQEVAADIVVVVPARAVAARDLALSFGAQVLDDPGSLSAAINVGFDSAQPRHKYVNWLGDDDLLTPGSLVTARNALDRDPSAVVAFGYCDYIDSEGRLLWTSKAGRLAPWLMTWGPDLVPQPGCLFRLSDVVAVGGLDATLTYAMDLDLLLRLRGRGRMVNTGKTLSAFRWHATSTTVANRGPSLQEAAAVKRRYVSKRAARFSTLWEPPVQLATRLAARRLNATRTKDAHPTAQAEPIA